MKKSSYEILLSIWRKHKCHSPRKQTWEMDNKSNKPLLFRIIIEVKPLPTTQQVIHMVTNGSKSQQYQLSSEVNNAKYIYTHTLLSIKQS